MILEKEIVNPLLSKLNKELTEAVDKINNIDSYKSGVLKINISEALTAAEHIIIDNVIEAHTNTPLLIDVIKDSYYKHETNGVSYFNDTRAWLIEKVLTGQITEPDIFFIEAKINRALNMVMRGDWKSAQSEMLNNVTVEGPYTQEIADKMNGDIANYILTEY